MVVAGIKMESVDVGGISKVLDGKNGNRTLRVVELLISSDCGS